MERTALRILRRVAADGDVAVKDAALLGPRIHGDHRDQYPLARLIEADYLGLTAKRTPPKGAEEMQGFTLAIELHLATLPKSPGGEREYRGVQQIGEIPTDWNRVYLTAKGALYLGELAEKRTERLFTVFIAVLSACLAAWFTALS
jgi:hypothetical protein